MISLQRKACLAILSRISRWLNIPINLIIQLSTGSKMIIVLPDTLSTVVAYTGDFETEVTEYLKRYLKPGDSFFDVGAHFGLRSIQAYDITKADVQIVAFEPGSQQLKILRQNLKEKSQIKIVPKAVSDTSNKFAALILFDTRFVGSSTLEKPRLMKKHITQAMHTAKQIKVKTIKLDDYCKKSGIIPDLIKIDVENHEYKVLQGAKTILKKYHPKIILEVGEVGRNKENSTSNCLRLLKQYNYQFKYLKKGKLIKYLPSDLEQNIVCL